MSEDSRETEEDWPAGAVDGGSRTGVAAAMQRLWMQAEAAWRGGWRTRWPLMLAMVVLGGGLIYVLLPAEEPAAAPGSNVAQDQARARPSAAGHGGAVHGAELAAAKKELRDPFQLQHSTQLDREKAATTVAAPPPAEAPAASPAAPAAAAAPAAMASPAPAPVVPQLTGIVQGDQGAIALLRVGEQSGALAAGESLAGWQVVDIASDSAVVSDGSETVRLPMTQP